MNIAGWKRLIGPAALAMAMAAGTAHAETAGTGPKADEAVALVKKAVAYVNTAGEDQAFKDFSNTSGEWVKGEFYIFCHRYDGINVAHGGNPGLVGKSVVGFKDPDGVLVNVQMIEGVPKGQHWFEYKWPNPTTKKVEPKEIYAEDVKGKYLCGSGYYK